jgi:hypothetical protein
MRDSRTLFLGVFIMVVWLSGPASAQPAVPGLGAPIILQQTGEVQATFARGDTAVFCDFYLDSPTNSLDLLWSSNTGNTSPPISLGTFPAGTELVFKLQHWFPGRVYDPWYTGPGSRNSDGWPHAIATFRPATGQWGVAFGSYPDDFGGDSSFENAFISIRTIPEPASILLCVSAGILLFVGRRGTVRRQTQ